MTVQELLDRLQASTDRSAEVRIVLVVDGNWGHQHARPFQVVPGEESISGDCWFYASIDKEQDHEEASN